MGTVKDLEILREPSERELGLGRFVFSDRYSVFDWGVMPDQIPGKGESLCLMSAYFFEKLEDLGVRTHYLGLRDSSGDLVRLRDLDEPTRIMEIKLVRVIRPRFIDGRYDYSVFTPQLRNFLIPMEFIYRNYLPDGSSVFKRIKRGELKPEDLGLDREPRPGERLPRPFFDVSTKLEESDRYLRWEEAMELAGVTEEEASEIKRILEIVNDLITKEVERIGLTNDDGKIELAFDEERRLMVVDSVGTLDECRFRYGDVQVSKEMARAYYRGTRWYFEVEEAKRKAREIGIEDWRSLCKISPPRLDPDLLEIISNAYKAVANELTGRRFFDCPSLKDVVEEYREYLASRIGIA